MARALRKRLGIESPRWRAFQLAFLLLNLPGLANPRDANRATVDLLFFPTGGGKTEAYLGLAAFVIAHRRLTGSGVLGAGVAARKGERARFGSFDDCHHNLMAKKVG